MTIELGDLIRIVPEPDFDFWNNTQLPVDRSKLKIYKVRQISHNFAKNTYSFALEDITNPGSIETRSLHDYEFELVPHTRDGTPYTRILKD